MVKKKKFKGESKLNKQRPSKSNTTLNEKPEEGFNMDPRSPYPSPSEQMDRMFPIMRTETGAFENSAVSLNPLTEIKEKEIPLDGGGREGRRLGHPTPILPSADFDMDILQGQRMFSPSMISLPGISKFLTQDQIEELHKGEFVRSGGYEKGMDLSKQDPFFYAVCGTPGGTIIANGKGSVLIPGISIPLGSKFDYRF